MSAVLDALRMLGVQGSALASVGCLMVVFYMPSEERRGTSSVSWRSYGGVLGGDVDGNRCGTGVRLD